LLRYYGGSHIEALRTLYPELDLKPENFPSHLGQLFSLDPERRRKFTDEFAKSKNFNPLDAEKWYTIKLKDFMGIVSSVIRIDHRLIFFSERWNDSASHL
jgi:hypothetical protein